MKKTANTLLALGIGLLALALVYTFTRSNPGEPEVEVMASMPAGYEIYDQARFNELHGQEPFAVFFHADWCPTCRALETRIKKDPSVLGGRVMLRANYDREVALKKQYEAMVQTTVIFFYEDGSVAHKRVNPSINFIRDFFSQ
ncbi:MAG: thioredoxin family protein [Candidatus Peregrinibacteria bacterium]|nr:thioredoxin family protein [Candidatus Peregrinibacteria bacterium]